MTVRQVEIMAPKPKVIIYTDGACDPNPGPGGWAALLRFGQREKTISGSDPSTTNNRMELTAAIQAINTLNRPSQVELYTDSEYLKKGITEWLPNWRQRNWRRKGGALANVDLWQELDKALQTHDIRWHWVKGHASNHDNKRVDQLARQAISRG
jgi:ribonuclease HI